MTKLNLYERACLILLLVAAMAVASPAQTFTTLVSFDYSNGALPTFPSLVQGLDGDLHGTTAQGGANLGGTVFKITTSGTLTTLYSFCSQAPFCMDGRSPLGGLIQDPDRNFYGTTLYNGTNFGGTVFKISPQGALTTLYNFACCTASNSPTAE
jgi:uncharacterized repeat protein (TIGR03803 family)